MLINFLQAQYIGETEDDMETVVGSEDDEVDLEITRALRRSKSGGETGAFFSNC